MAKGNISVDSENLFPIIKKSRLPEKSRFVSQYIRLGNNLVTAQKQFLQRPETAGPFQTARAHERFQKDWCNSSGWGWISA